MRRRLIERFRVDRGAALPIVAGMLMTLLGLTAFATDLGWFYLNASRVQRAADAGALAGVIRMPFDFTEAGNDAREITRTNGYTDGVEAVSVLVEEVPGEPNQLDVTVTDTVDTFFARIFGLDTVTIARSARAEYVPPVRMGSPENTFGNTCDPEQSGCGGQPNFWANIHGKWTSRGQGDPYGTACASANDDPNCAANPLYGQADYAGYLYGIDAAGAGSFTVTFIDLAFHNNSGAQTPGDNIRTGDNGCQIWGPSTSPDCGPTMQVRLYAPDSDPVNVANNTLLCDTTIGPRPQVAETVPYVAEAHSPCLTVAAPDEGIYVVQVNMVDPGAVTDRSGLNRYSIQSTSGELFALDRMSIYNNAEATTAFYLAEVPDYYANKTFVVEMFDPGEGAAGDLQMIDPRTGSSFTGTCRFYTRNNPTVDWTLQGNPSPCLESVSLNEYNDRWLKFEMDLPSDYACGSDCWWKVNYAYGGSIPNDTTTWRAFMVGNPIHLVPSD